MGREVLITLFNQISKSKSVGFQCGESAQNILKDG